MNLLSRVDVTIGPALGGGNGAQAYYKRSGHRLYVPANVDAETLLHELAHAANDFDGFGAFAGSRDDEGVGYTVGLTSSFLVGQLKSVENNIKRAKCDRETVRRAWEALWKNIAQPQSWIEGHYLSGLIHFSGKDSDILNTEKQTKLDYSCEKWAAAINGHLKDCCFRVSCEAKPESGRHVGTGVQLSPAMK